MKRKCAICGRESIYWKYEICSGCYKEWGNKAPWIKALIKLERRNRYMNISGSEINFTDLINKKEEIE